MKVGVCTWIFGGEPLEKTAQRVAAMGYDGVELLGDLERNRAGEVATLLQAEGLSVLSLTPENVDLAHPEPAVRAAAVDYYLRLLDFAAGLGRPVVCCHGDVGRIRALSTCGRERALLLDAVGRIGEQAASAGLRLAMEVLNRYESHLLNTAAEAVAFVDELGMANVGILLDAFHMNLEEAEPAQALRTAGDRLFLFHAADSNRRGVGLGHTDFSGLFRALHDIGYGGDVVVECTAPGPDPFTPVKGEGWKDTLDSDLQRSLEAVRRLAAGS